MEKYNLCRILMMLLIFTLLPDCRSLNINKEKADTLSFNQEILTQTYQGNTENVKALLIKGATANAMTNNGTTALMVAASTGNNETVEVLQQPPRRAEEKE